jgi:hypothetical protein
MALDQDTSRAQCLTPRTKTFPARADVVFYNGAIVCKRRDSKYVEIPDPTAPRTDLIPLGICTAFADSTDLADGDISVCVEAGAYRDFATGTSTNAVTSNHVGQVVYMYDDDTLYATDNGGTLSPAGELVFVDANEHDGSTQLTVYFDWEKMALLSAVESLSESFGFDAATELTIASGAVTVTQSNHTIDTEADAGSDNLDTVAGMVANQLYLFRPASAARTVVLRDASVGAGNLRTPFGQSISLAESDDWALGVSDGTDVTILAFRTLAADGGGAGAIIGLLSALSTAEQGSVVGAINEVYDFATAAPAMQAVNATLVAGTVTINSSITVATDSEVVPVLIGALSGTTNFGQVGELKASRVNGAPGVGTVVIQAYGDDGALDVDAAGAIRVLIFTPQI